jgi:hypothetical protein
MTPGSNDFYWHNVPDMPPRKDFLLKHRPIFLKIKNSLPENAPFYFYMFNGNIKFLEILKHSEKVINILNDIGVHIFLYEPIITKFIDTEDFSSYHSELPTDFQQDDITVLEFESIKKYAIANKLTNITVHTCDYDVEIHYSKYLKYMKLICDDVFLNLCHLPPFTPLAPRVTRKFICLNWRYVTHRALIALYLADKSAHLSWFFTVNRKALTNHAWFNFKNFSKTAPKFYSTLDRNVTLLNKKVPVCVDIKIKKPTTYLTPTGEYFFYPGDDDINPAFKNNNSKDLECFYRGSFCDIVTESRFAQPTANYSEKLYHAIKHYTPFVLVAPPKTLEYAKSNGFLTFDKYWDESYDDCVDHEKRLVKIFEVIDYIDNLSMRELEKIKKDMSPILIKNRKTLEDIVVKHRE